MKLSSPTIDIPPDDPFKNDKLGRSDIEPSLTQLISRSSSSFVLSIDGAWGTGKTTFLDMWKVKLEHEKHICLKFNAWETDFAEDPLIVLVHELSTKLKEVNNVFNPTAENLRKATGSILKRSIPAAVKVFTAGLIENSDVEKVFATLTESLAEDSIKAYEEGYSAINEFRQTLSQVVQEISKEENKKIIIIVDELDRCRPSYAIELLERIKHLFNIDGVVFILGIDRTQLAESVKVLYGSNFDASGYLKRFIDIDYSLPEPKPTNSYFDYLFEHYEIYQLLQYNDDARNNLKDIKNDDPKVLEALFKASNFSLRDQIQTVSRLSIILKTIPKDEPIFFRGMLVLLFLREWKRELYRGLIERSINSDAILKEFNSILSKIDKLPRHQQGGKSLASEVEALLIVGIGEINLDAQGNPISPRKLIESIKEKTLDYLKSYYDMTDDGEFNPSSPYPQEKVGFKTNIKRLELLNQFQFKQFQFAEPRYKTRWETNAQHIK